MYKTLIIWLHKPIESHFFWLEKPIDKNFKSRTNSLRNPCQHLAELLGSTEHTLGNADVNKVVSPESTPKVGIYPYIKKQNYNWKCLLWTNGQITSGNSPKESALVNRIGVILLHYNNRPHTHIGDYEKLEWLHFETIQHSVYSPDFHDFRLMQNMLI